MADSKTYLNVPFAKKDASKALGARWDATYKKCYVPADKDSTLFAQWQSQFGEKIPASKINGEAEVRVKSAKNGPSAQNTKLVAFTHPANKDFIPYNGDEPPWD